MSSDSDVEVISIDDETYYPGVDDADPAAAEIFSQAEAVYDENPTENESTHGQGTSSHGSQGTKQRGTEDTIDLTATTWTPQPIKRASSRTQTELPVLSFKDEYEGLLEAADGRAFPAEAVAELLLRHPGHWWCR